MLYKLTSIVVYFLLRLFFKLEVKGKNNIPRNQPFILASNHASHLDPPTLAVSCPVKIGFLAKEELFSSKLATFYFNSVGAIPLKRGESDISAMRLSLKVLKTKPLLIFPQGHRSENFDEITAGVGFLCKKANVPVIVARIYGTDKVFPKGAKSFRKGKVKVIFSRVDNIKTGDTNKEIASKVMEKIKSL